MDASLTRPSRLLSLLLRHRPELGGLSLDRQGYVEVDELLAGLARLGVHLSREELLGLVRDNDKQRFALSTDGRRIRASQGHSIPVDLGYAPEPPPPLLFHGTARRRLASIRQQGLLPAKRHAVHLSATRELALRVGARHGAPVVLEVDAGRMHREGHEFFVTPNGVWLTAQVPPVYLRWPAG